MNIKEKRRIKNLTYHLIKRGRITTTVPAARLVKRKVEKLITRAKKDNVVNRRRIARFLPDDGVDRLLSVIGPANISKCGGYTRMLRLDSPQKGDGTQKCILEIINV